MLPRIVIFDRQDSHRVDCSALEKSARAALPLCLAAAGAHGAVLPSIEELEVSLITDSEMARVHGRFLGDESATDVITFQHGEIVASVDTAAREAGARGHAIEIELLLYVIHGLLHLNGHLDDTAASREAMAGLQESILHRALSH
jgi:probable rRNA maturation factor